MYTTRCESTQRQLSALHDGALSPWRVWLLRGHLQRCVGCRNQYAALERLHSLLLAGDVIPGSLQELPQAVNLPVFAAESGFARPGRVYPKRRLVSRLVGGLAAASVVVFGLLYIPSHKDTLKPNPLSASAQVRRALANINTWHLKGWKIQNGERVPWEVWGQRKPFFYREQIGPDILLDDGVKRVSLYAPFETQYNRPRGTRQGVALIMPSNSDAENVRWSYRRMVDHWRPDMWVWKQTLEGPIFNENSGGYVNEGDKNDSMTDFLYAINKHTWLPHWFEIRRGKVTEKERQPTAHLEITYDVPVPESVHALLTPPADYVTYDSTRKPPETIGDSAVTKGGLTVALKALATDDEGNVLIEARAWIGDTPVAKDSPIQIGLSVTDDASLYLHSASPRLSYDGQKRPYIEVSWYALQYGNPDESTRLMIRTPMEPIPAGTPTPDRLKVNLMVGLMMDSRMGGTLGQGDRVLLQQEMEVPVTLPSPGEPLPQRISDFLTASGMERLGVYSLEPLDVWIKYARMGNYRNMHSEAARKRYFFWAEQYVASGVFEWVQMERENLVNAYLAIGNRKRAVELLYEILNEPRFRDIPPAMHTMPKFWKAGREGWQEEVRRHSKYIKQRSAEYREKARAALQRLGEPVK